MNGWGDQSGFEPASVRFLLPAKRGSEMGNFVRSMSWATALSSGGVQRTWGSRGTEQRSSFSVRGSTYLGATSRHAINSNDTVERFGPTPRPGAAKEFFARGLACRRSYL